MTDADLAARLARIAWLTEQLSAVLRDTEATKLLIADIQREIAVSRNALQILDTHPPFRNRR